MDGYTVLSRVYDAALEPVNAPVRQRAHRMCPTPAGSVVLDVGCGTGAALAEYAADGCAVIGLDTSPAMLDRARHCLGPDAQLRLISGDVLPVEDGCADLVLVSLVLHSVPRNTALGLLGEARRALSPSGTILITDFGGGRLKFPRGHLTRGASALAEVLAGPRHARNCLHYLRSGGLTPLLADAGLHATTSRPTAGGNITITLAQPNAAT